VAWDGLLPADSCSGAGGRVLQPRGSERLNHTPTTLATNDSGNLLLEHLPVSEGNIIPQSPELVLEKLPNRIFVLYDAIWRGWIDESKLYTK
jgi:hypothetical protein